jgi:large subunit ribosomal protein L17
MPTGSRKLSRKAASRDHLMRNLATSLVLYEKVDTTIAKAKETKAIVDHLISKAKENTLASRRYLLTVLFDKNAVKKMYEVLVPRYSDRTGGFIRIAKLGTRLGDGSTMARLELMDKDAVVDEKATKKDNASKKEGVVAKKPVAKTTRKPKNATKKTDETK